MKRRLSAMGLLSVCFMSWGCSPPKPVEFSSPPLRRQTPPPLVAPQKLPIVSYEYQGDRYRDPFIPLGGRAAGTGRGELIIPQLGALALKGIIADQQKKVALIVGGGGVFVLKDGKLYDNRNRLIRGISGVVKDRSVILTGPDRTVRELALK